MATPYKNRSQKLTTNPICFGVEKVLARPPPGPLELWTPVMAGRRRSAWYLLWEALAAIPLVVARCGGDTTHTLAAAALPFVFWVAAAL